jgi:uncharacterized membrane protein (DUF485 family)
VVERCPDKTEALGPIPSTRTVVNCLSLALFMDIDTLIKKRDKEITGFFWLGLQIAFIFGIPAFLSFMINKRLTEVYGRGHSILLFVSSFIFSWIIVIIIYLRKAKKLKILEDEIKRLRKAEKTK